MSLTLFFLIGLVLLVGALVVIDDWWLALPLLLGAELCRVGLAWRTSDLASGATGVTLLVVEVVTVFSVGLILMITALTLSRDYHPAELDEFALLELRRAARKAQYQRLNIAGRWGAIVVPLGAVMLAGLATWLLSTFYPVARQQEVDAGWIFLLLCGLTSLITANDVLRLGLGLLMLMASVKLVYFGLAVRLNVLQVGLLEVLSLVLAVIVAYLSVLLYGRLRTLELGSLFERRCATTNRPLSGRRRDASVNKT